MDSVLSQSVRGFLGHIIVFGGNSSLLNYMRPTPIVHWMVCSLLLVSPVFASENPRSGDWLLINGLVVLQVTDDGMMTLRNTGMSGKLTVADDGNFTWEIADQPTTKGRFESDRLLLQNMQPGIPKWIQMLEFKRADKDTASEVIEVALRQQTSALTAMAKVRENAIRMTVLNNLRQLAAAADQHFLENGTSKATYEQLVGTDKYIKKLEPADGEDYSSLDFNQSNSELKVITSSGVIVTYER